MLNCFFRLSSYAIENTVFVSYEEQWWRNTINLCRSSCKVCYFVQLQPQPKCADKYLEIQTWNILKIRPMGVAWCMRKDRLTDGRNEANSSIPRGNEVVGRKSDIKTGGKCKELKNRSREIGIRMLQGKQKWKKYRKYININFRQTKVSRRRRRRNRKLVRRVKRLFSSLSFLLPFFEEKKK